MLFNQLLATEVADSTSQNLDIEKTVSSFAKLVESLSKYSTDELIGMAVEEIVKFGFKILLAIAIFLIGKWLIKKIDFLITKLMDKRKVEISLRTFLRSFIKITLNFLMIIFIIGALGINTSSFIALFASAGVAIGMALSGTLQNFAGGIMILVFKPYKVGDFIEAQGYMGIEIGRAHV